MVAPRLCRGCRLGACRTWPRLPATFFAGNIAPDRTILFERKDERRRTLESRGIKTVATLIEAVKTPTRLATLAKQCETGQEYLTILARQARSYRPAPVALARFGGGDDPTPGELAAHGLKNSRHLYDAVARMGSVEALATHVEEVGYAGPQATEWDVAF